VPKPIQVKKSILENLYLKKGLGSYEIARALNCSQTCVISKLKSFSIPTRSIQEAKSLAAPKYKRNDFRGNLFEKAYMIGFRLGDLYITKTHPNSPTIRIQTNTTKKEQIILMERLFSKYGHFRVYPVDRRGARSVRVFVNTSFEFLCPKSDLVPDWIEKNQVLFCSFLGGYIDAEGSFISKQNTAFTIQSQDKNILFSIFQFLNRSGVDCAPPQISRLAGSKMNDIISRKNVYSLRIYNRENLIKLIELIESNIMHSKRKADMNKVLKKLNYVRT